MRFTLEKLNSAGVAHHALIAVLVISTIAGFGAWRVFQSNAQTSSVPAQYQLRVATEDGCWAAGRVWNSEKKDCTAKCRASGDTYKTKVGTDGISRGYCEKAVGQTLDLETCVNQYHRMYIKEIGCARRVDQENTNRAKQCIGNNVPDTDPMARYKTYYADVKADRCIEDKVVPPSPATPSEAVDAIKNPLCEQLGRKRTATGCARVCLPGSGVLMIDSSSTPTRAATNIYYCNFAVASAIGEQRCAELHRVWLQAGCARRPDQQDNPNDSLHCIAGYPYYRSNSEASKSGFLDVCEKDKVSADANEAAGIVGSLPDGQPVIVCKGGQIRQPDGSCKCPDGQSFSSSTCEAPDDSNHNCPVNARWSYSLQKCVCTADGKEPVANTCPEPGGDSPAGPDEVVSIDGDINQRNCTLLYGRAWEVGVREDGTTGIGCSRESCDNPAVTSILAVEAGSTAPYCKGYAQQIEKTRCESLHRKWIDAAKACALYPDQKDGKRLTGAIQCEGGSQFNTYVVKTGTPDACVKASINERIKYVASKFNVPVRKVAKVGPRAFCETARNSSYHWVDSTGKCVKDRETPDSGSSKVTKVVIFVEENRSYEQMKNQMPYAFQQGKKFGYATNYNAHTHPSLPNYIVMAAGSDMGVKANGEPAKYPLNGESIFGRTVKAGKTAKIYAEGMNSNCGLQTDGRYAPRHNPWTYFTDERELCRKYDVPFKGNFDKDVKAGALPNVSMVIPDNCNNAHDQGCTLKRADDWFKKRMELIYKSPDWKAGRLVVVLTADEDDREQKNDSDNKVLTTVMHPSLEGKVVNSRLTHFSLSKFMAEVADIKPLRNAQDAPSLMKAFKLGDIPDGGGGYPTPAPPLGSANFRAATFNVLGASHTDGPKANKPHLPPYQPRLVRAVKVINDAGLDVVGLQEFQQPQRKMLMDKYDKTFDIYPRTAQYGGGASVNSIIWRQAKFTFIDGGTKKFRYFGNGFNEYPWVRLKDKESGREFIFANVHDPADVNGPAAGKRYHNAVEHLQNMEEFMNRGFPVVFVGDYNSSTRMRSQDRRFSTDRNKLPYCVMSSKGTLINAYDAVKDRKTGGKCPAPTSGISIDQVWVDSKSDVKKYAMLHNKDVNYATDHKYVVYADVILRK